MSYSFDSFRWEASGYSPDLFFPLVKYCLIEFCDFSTTCQDMHLFLSWPGLLRLFKLRIHSFYQFLKTLCYDLNCISSLFSISFFWNTFLRQSVILILPSLTQTLSLLFLLLISLCCIKVIFISIFANYFSSVCIIYMLSLYTEFYLELITIFMCRSFELVHFQSCFLILKPLNFYALKYFMSLVISNI